jgi:rhodanese-related sulfurtransferase
MDLLKKSYKNVTSEDVNKMMSQSDVQVIDVRESYEYAMGHIDGAQLISLQTIPNNLDKIDQSKKIVLVCASGGRSVSASEYLMQHGYEVYNMVGGMMSWRFAIAR